MLLSRFRWYRKFRGGRWCCIANCYFGREWIQLPGDCVANLVHEDYQ